MLKSGACYNNRYEHVLVVTPPRVLTSVELRAVASVPVSARNVPESCGVRDWFQLRDKVAQGGSSPRFRNAMDVAFEHRSQAAHELKKVIREALLPWFLGTTTNWVAHSG